MLLCRTNLRTALYVVLVSNITVNRIFWEEIFPIQITAFRVQESYTFGLIQQFFSLMVRLSRVLSRIVFKLTVILHLTVKWNVDRFAKRYQILNMSSFM